MRSRMRLVLSVPLALVLLALSFCLSATPAFGGPTINQFPLSNPAGSYSESNLTVGPDGALWL